MFRFTIRDVLWLTLVVALACGWSLHWASSREQHEALLKDHMRALIQQSDAAGAGTGQMVAQTHAQFDFQRKYMEELRKGAKLKVEFSNRLLQELGEARRIDAARAKLQANKEPQAVEARDN